MHPSQIMRTARALVFVTLGAVGAINLLHLATATPPPATYKVPDAMLDIVVQAERRFAPCRAALLHRGIAGPLAYFESPAETPGSPQVSDSFLAQHALLPLILDRDATQSRWALANFVPGFTHPLPSGWDVAEDFGRGVLLLRRSEKR